MKTKLTEKAFQAMVNQLAQLLRWKFYHTHDSRRSQKGFPDMVLLRGKRQIAAELKVPPNVTTPEQDEWLAAFAAAGAETYVWYPVDWGAIVEVLT